MVGIFQALTLISLFFSSTLPGYADFVYSVNSTQGLPQIAGKLKAAVDSGTHVIQFSAYASPGQFKIESPPTKVETLVFTRDSTQESDSAIQVGDTALIDIKKMRGTVILKGLAFRLTTPNAVLISGAELGKENSNLIIDSCFIFSDNLTSSFLSWFGSPGSKVEIKRSFLVSRTGAATTARVTLSAGSVSLANNLINFPGQLAATLVGGTFECRSNTINRTQFKLTAELFQGASPSYFFNRNFIAHRGAADAFGPSDPYFLYATGFDPQESFVRSTRLFKTWKGFDHHVNPIKGFAADTTNKLRDSLSTVSPTEMWNFYAIDSDTSIGMLDGNNRRSQRYNVWPGETSFPFIFEFNPWRVWFRSASFPRQFSPARVTADLPADLNTDLRVHAPKSGAMRFGSFQVDSVNISINANFGSPVLLASDASARFVPQRTGLSNGLTDKVFPNDSLKARYYFLSFRGNTRRGTDIIPNSSSSLGVNDTLAFSRVDSAGSTLIKEMAPPSAYPDDLRYLMRNMDITTSASVSETMVFGSRDSLGAYQADQVHWWDPKAGSLTKATRSPSGKYHARVPASQVFVAYLVEKLNVKRGGVTLFPLADGAQARVTSRDGFQLRIDSNRVTDTLHYGSASRQYSFFWKGGGAGDSLELRLPGGGESELLRLSGDTLVSLPAIRDSAGYFLVSVPKADSMRKFFSAVRFNVIAEQVFSGTLEGVTFGGLLSSTSGKIGANPFDNRLLDPVAGKTDNLPVNARFLGGKTIRSSGLKVGPAYQVTFVVSAPNDRSQVETYAWNGASWRRLPQPVFPSSNLDLLTIPGLGNGDTAVIAMERLLPAETYVSTKVDTGSRKLIVSSRFLDETVRGPITSFSLVVQSVDQFGKVSVSERGPIPINEGVTVDFSEKNGLFAYGIKYGSKDTSYTSRPIFTYVTNFSWNPGMLQVGEKVKPVDQWYLVGFPYATGFKSSLIKLPNARDSILDISSAYRLKNVAGKPEWDSLKQESALTFQPGEAIMFASSHPYRHAVDSMGSFLTAREFSLSGPPEGGWKLISSPYPMTFHRAKIRSSTTLGPFLRLDTIPPLSASNKREYIWVPTDTLQSFRGYAYNFQPGETLTFNPWDALVFPVSPAIKLKPSALEAPSSVEVSFAAGGAKRSMRLLSGKGARDVSFLPAPGAGLEVRIGGKDGYLWKMVDDLGGIDEPVTIKSGTSTRAALTLARSGSGADRADWQVRLLDLSSGRIHEQGDFSAISVPAGSSEYRLIAGEEAFVRGRIQGFQAGIPADMMLSQNFPNPFRNQTRITLLWPAQSLSATGSVGRSAWIEVFDARGKRVHKMDLGPIRVGRQVVSLDASSWEAGVYSYRLTMVSGGARAHLQKRMLVTR